MRNYYAVVEFTVSYQADIEVEDDTTEEEARGLCIEEARDETGIGQSESDVCLVEAGWRDE